MSAHGSPTATTDGIGEAIRDARFWEVDAGGPLQRVVLFVLARAVNVLGS